ncbi:AI-2E family transporter [Methylocella sp.]|uniref:AI-2E family transporter n=1 Tax=Methylocella sp. TaxID=1978226 RepID=UPI003783E10E
MSDVFDAPQRRPPEERDPGRSIETLTTAVIATLCVVALYAARGVLVPVAIAVLLSFVLSIPVRALRRLGFNRVVAVLAVVLAALALTFMVSAAMTRQVADLATSLPQYEETIKTKASALRELVAANSALEKGAAILKDIGRLGRGPSGEEPAQGPARGESARIAPAGEPEPVPVVVHEAEPTPLAMLQTVLGTALSPLETMAIVAIFVIFILLQREDLRNRFIRLAGARDLQRTSVAMNDAASRLSRYFLAQFLLNASFGVVVAAGLYLIGVPGAILFGLVGFLMRFVPYVGAVVTAALPVALAAAVDPGWGMALKTAAMFVVIEAAVGHFIEPLLYGRNTGLSPIAVVAAATFWTWLWGPVGLLLATPLTVCLVVLGRHVEQLSFLDVILGDAPALTPVEHFYQRLLVDDASEIADQAEVFLKTGPLVAYYDEVALSGLALAEADARRGVLTEQRQKQMKETVREIAENLSDHEDEEPEGRARPAADREPVADLRGERDTLAAERAAAGAKAPDDAPPAAPPRKPVLCVAGRDALDEAAAILLAQILEKHGVAAKVEPADLLRVGGVLNLAGAGAQMICLSYVGAEAGAAQARYAVRRLRRRLPDACIVVGLWRADEAQAADFGAQTRADLCVARIDDATRHFVEAQRRAVLSRAIPAPQAVPTPPPSVATQGADPAAAPDAGPAAA